MRKLMQSPTGIPGLQAWEDVKASIFSLLRDICRWVFKGIGMATHSRNRATAGPLVCPSYRDHTRPERRASGYG